jgi:hypothetical protein
MCCSLTTCLPCLQIYCPLDDYEASAYHRCLYVFCCKKATCNEKGNIQCLRSQLPKENCFYKKTGEGGQEQEQGAGAGRLSLCSVCGLQGSYCCSACASSPHPARYCSKKHQQVDWKCHKHVCGAVGGELDPAVLQRHKRHFTFAEYDIDIEEEDLRGEHDGDSDGDGDDSHDIKKALKSSKINPDTIIWEDAGKLYSIGFSSLSSSHRASSSHVTLLS